MKKRALSSSSEPIILINRSDAIGDTLLTAPMAQLIKSHLPKAQVHLLISKRCQHLLQKDQFIDSIEVLPTQTHFQWPFVRKIIKQKKIDTYIYAGGSHLPSFVAWLSGIKWRLGLLSRWPSFLFLNAGIRQQRSLVEMHELEYNLNLLSALGVNYHHDQLKNLKPVSLKVGRSEQETKDFLKQMALELELDFPGEWIVIHPGMSGHTLNWPSASYAQLCLRLERRFPGRFLFLFTYTPSDKSYIEGVKMELRNSEFQSVKKRLMLFDGSIKGLQTTMDIIKGAALFIGPSTGTTHIANALGTASVSLYSPIKTQSSLRWGPIWNRGEKSLVIVPDVICGEAIKCAGESCPYYECMSKIEVEDVMIKAMSLLSMANKSSESENV